MFASMLVVIPVFFKILTRSAHASFPQLTLFECLETSFLL